MATTNEGRFLSSGDEAGTAPGDRKLRPDVEGMRAIAILLVLFCHYWIPGFVGGWVGVDVFFVISGFVITGLLLRERDSTGRTSLLDFYARRGRRIIPLAMLVVVVTMLLERCVIGQAQTVALADPARWVVFFSYNFDHAVVQAEVFQPQPFAPYWSLAVEEQFYLAYPALILAAVCAARGLSWRLKVNTLLCGVIAASLTWSILSSGVLNLISYDSSLTRAWELAVGCLIAWNMPLVRRIGPRVGAVMTWVGIALVVASVFVDTASVPYPGWRAILPVAGTAFVIIGGTPVPGWGTERILGLRPLRAIGRWSFSLYLWQIPVMTLAIYWWGPLKTLPLWGRVALILATVIIAATSYSTFESRIRHSPRLIASPVLSLGCAAAFILGALVTISLVAR